MNYEGYIDIDGAGRNESLDFRRNRSGRISKNSLKQELVALLLASPRWSQVTCVVRKQPQEWATLPNSQKLQVEVFPNLDDYFKQENTHYQNTDSLFSCFGSQVKHGEETFVKVDKLYPLWAADIARKNSINPDT